MSKPIKMVFKKKIRTNAQKSVFLKKSVEKSVRVGTLYIPRRWQFKGSPNNLPPWGRNQRIFYGLISSRRSFSKYLSKKIWKMIPMLRNVVITQKCRFRENYPNTLFLSSHTHWGTYLLRFLGSNFPMPVAIGIYRVYLLNRPLISIYQRFLKIFLNFLIFSVESKKQKRI